MDVRPQITVKLYNRNTHRQGNEFGILLLFHVCFFEMFNKDGVVPLVHQNTIFVNLGPTLEFIKESFYVACLAINVLEVVFIIQPSPSWKKCDM